jgi:cation diffusion facilitator CzcD-associated flavoprotein CzcO
MQTMQRPERFLRIAVIGAGASGIMAAIKLREAGQTDVTVFEKASSLGGTWRDNRYPGLSCDVPSLAYRYSFAANPDWSHAFAPGPEILAYLKEVARRYDVEPMIRFECEIVRAEHGDGRWRLTSSQGGEGDFDLVLTATGVLHHPVTPPLPGLETFAGRAFHTSRWDDAAELDGARVGIIGSGSTAVQIVTAITSRVKKLTLFQRTAQWVLPLPNPATSEEERAGYRANPQRLDQELARLNDEQGTKFANAVVGANPGVYRTLTTLCEAHLGSVRDPDLRRRLTPDHKVGCKRLVMSDGFYEAIQHPNAELIDAGIQAIEPAGVRTIDGTLHALDVLVLATGFNTHQFFRPMTVIGRGGRSLDEAWADRNEGYLGVMTPCLPNWFMIGGPNSPIGNFSWLQTAELQMGYILQLIDALVGGRAAEITPTERATADFNAALLAKVPDTIWASGCRSWYMDDKGHVASWPWTYETFLDRMAKPVLEDFELT